MDRRPTSAAGMNLLPRLILLHKQATSGRVRFLRMAGSVLAFSPLPVPAVLRDEAAVPNVQCHPGAAVREAEVLFGLEEGSIAAEAGFQAWVDAPSGDLPVLLACFTTLDPPFAAVERRGGRFIQLTDTRDLPEVERLLLRRAYEHVLG
jgi:hypothetical protein